MPSPRRLRLLLMVVLAAVVTTLFFTSQWRGTSERDTRTIQDFYHKTMNAMEGKRGSGGAQIPIMNKERPVEIDPKDKDGDGTVDDDDRRLAAEMSERLKAAEIKAKEQANAKAPKPDPPHEVVGVGSSAGGQKKPKKGASSESVQEETEEEHEIEETLNTIFKKSPVIIISKSYCPYSKRAKGVLLEKYAIDPKPYVVELDEHPLGQKLQEKLGEMTGRKTVPNIMINGKTIGGSDEIAELETSGTLVDTIKRIGGKRVSMKERFVDNSNKRQ